MHMKGNTSQCWLPDMFSHLNPAFCCNYHIIMCVAFSPPHNPFRTLELMLLEIAFLWLWAFILAIKLTRFWDLGETQYGIYERPLTGCGRQPNRENGNASHLAYWILNVTPVCQGSSGIRQCQYKQEHNNVSCLLAKHLRQIVWLVVRNAL